MSAIQAVHQVQQRAHGVTSDVELDLALANLPLEPPQKCHQLFVTLF